MNPVVVDASTAIKWYVPEVHWSEALRWRDASLSLHAPLVFFDVEIGNILWKKFRRGELTRGNVDAILLEFTRLPIQRHDVTSLLPRAMEIAITTDRTVYDSLYVALAEHLHGKLVTADERLFNSLTKGVWGACVCKVTDAPS